jgi:hypothetical protein
MIKLFPVRPSGTIGFFGIGSGDQQADFSGQWHDSCPSPFPLMEGNSNGDLFERVFFVECFITKKIE